MKAKEPNVPPTARFSVKQTCAILGICRNTLRRYTQNGLIKENRRMSNLRPYYTGKAIHDCWRISMF